MGKDTTTLEQILGLQKRSSVYATRGHEIGFHLFWRKKNWMQMKSTNFLQFLPTSHDWFYEDFFPDKVKFYGSKHTP